MKNLKFFLTGLSTMKTLKIQLLMRTALFMIAILLIVACNPDELEVQPNEINASLEDAKPTNSDPGSNEMNDQSTAINFDEIVHIDAPDIMLEDRNAKKVFVNDRNPATFAKSLKDAVIKAGNGGIVELGWGDYWSDKIILLPEGIKTTIKGKGKKKTTLNLAKWIAEKPGFLTLNANGSSVKNMMVNVNNNLEYGKPAVNTNGKKDCYLYDVTFANSSIGTGTPDNRKGLVPSGLTLISCSFWNCDHGINFNRFWKKVPAGWVKKITIDACWFGGKQSAGISLDCGNDGLYGHPNFRGSATWQSEQTITDFNYTVIKNSTFEKAEKYNIAIAKAKNIIIENNMLKGTTGAMKWGENINVEHKAKNIWIERNTILNMGVWNKDQSYISVVAFNDYISTPSFKNGCTDVYIRQNLFKGNPKSGISGEFAKNITINNNAFTNPKPTTEHINFYKKNKNILHWKNKGIDKSKIRIDL